MAYIIPSIASVPINNLVDEVSAALGATGLMGVTTETGEDVRLAWASGQVEIAAGNFFWLRQNSVYIAENILQAGGPTLYAAKMAGVTPEYLKIEKWFGSWEEQELVVPEIHTVAVGGSLLNEVSFSTLNYGRIAITTESGEDFVIGFSSGEVDGAVGSEYAVIRQNGVWEIDAKDPTFDITIYLAKRSGKTVDNYKIETWKVA